MNRIIILTSLVAMAYLTGWIVSVGIVWIIQWLVNAVFEANFNLNIWLAGLLFYLIWLLLK